MIPDAYDEVVAPEPLMPDPEPEDALALVPSTKIFYCPRCRN